MACTTVFDAKDENEAATDWTPSTSPGAIRATCWIKGTWNERIIEVTGTADSKGSFPVCILSGRDPNPKNLDLIGDKVTFQILNPKNNSKTASLTLVVCE